MGKTKRLKGMTNDRGIEIVILQSAEGLHHRWVVAESCTWDKAEEGIRGALSSAEQYAPTLLFPFCSRSRS